MTVKQHKIGQRLTAKNRQTDKNVEKCFLMYILYILLYAFIKT